MAEGLETQLEVDISAALSAFQQLDQALAEVVANFSAGLTAAVAELSQAQLSVDTSQLTTDVQDALAAISTPVAIDADVTALESGIAAAVEPQTIPIEGDTSVLDAEIAASVAPVPLLVEGDTEGLTAAIAAAVTESQSVPVEGDTTAVQASIDALAADAIVIPIEVDTTAAEAEIEDLGAAAIETEGGVDSLSGGVEALSASAHLATGHTGELATGVASISPAFAKATTAAVVFGGFITEVTSLAADAEAQNRRFNETFGDLAESVRAVNVGGLTIDLEQLGIRSGTTNADLEATASRIGSLGKSSGASDAAIVGTTQKLLALGATVAVNNPRLGDAAEVTDRLAAAFARGGRALVPYGIALSAAQIIEEAKIETGKEDAAQLTIFEKAQAGATLAVRQFGGALGEEFAAGAENGQIQLRALKVALEETLATVGGPLLEPVVDSLEDLLPLAQELGVVLGELARATLPIIVSLAPVLGAISGPLGLVADGLHAVGTAVDFLPGPVQLLVAGGALLASTIAVALVPALAGSIPTLASFGAALDLALGPIGLIIIGLGALGLVAREFSNDSHAVADATTVFNDALFGAGAGADTLGGQLIRLDANLRTTLADFIEAQDTGSAFREALDGIGGGVAGLQSALTGSEAQFNSYRSAITAAAFETGDFFDAVEASDALDTQREALEASETQQLANLVSTNQLTQAQLDQIESTHLLEDGTVDLRGSLDAAGVVVAKAAAAAAKVAHENALAADSYTDLAASIKAGQTSAEDAVTVAEQLGITEADATTIIQDQLDAITAQNDKRIEASAAALQLRRELEAGNITAAQAEIRFLQLGVSLDGTKQLIDDAAESAKANAEALVEQRDAQILASDAAERLRSQLAHGAITAEEAETRYRALGLSLDSTTQEIDDTTKAVEALVSKGLAGLPESADAINDWQQSASDAFKQLADDATNETGSIKDDLAALNLAADPAVVVDNIIAQFQKVQAFSDNLLKLVADFPNAVRALISDPNKSAAAALAASLVNDKETAAAFDLSIAVADAKTDELNARLRGPIAAKLGEGGTVVGKAIFGPPGGVTDGVNEQSALEKILAAISGMETPLQSATRRLAEGGAAAFNPDLVTPTQAALGSVAQMIDASPQVADATRRLAQGGAAAFNPDLVTPAQAALGNVATAIDASAAVKDATRRLAEGGAAAFNPDLATSAQRAIANARATVNADGSIPSATGKKGSEAAGKFGEKADIAGVSVEQFNAAVDAISKLTAVGVEAALLGADAGEKFGQGMAAGIASKTSAVETAGSRLARAGAAAARGPQGFDSGSPSKVGVAIGGEFVEGVVVGLGNTTNLATSGARLATTISTSTAGALSAVGPQIVSNIVAGFNDPATIAAGIARLQTLVAQATAQSSASLSSFVTSASGALPTTGSDISSFSQRVTSALGEQTSALDAYHKASRDVAIDRQNLAQLLERERNATERLHQAVRAAFEDVAARKPQSTIDTDVAAVQAAQRNIAGIQSALGSARREAATDAGTLNNTANAFRAARDALTVASDPARFIENLNRQTRAAQAFQADIARLAQGGFTDLAEQLAQAGPETAGKLADALANRPARARQAEAAIDAASAFADSYQQFLEDQFAPQVTATAAKIGAAAGAALSSGISINGIPTSFATSQNVTVTAAGSAPAGPVRQVIELDLDISLPDGTTLTATKTIEAPTGQAVTRLKAAVKAKVNA